MRRRQGLAQDINSVSSGIILFSLYFNSFLSSSSTLTFPLPYPPPPRHTCTHTHTHTYTYTHTHTHTHTHQTVVHWRDTEKRRTSKHYSKTLNSNSLACTRASSQTFMSLLVSTLMAGPSLSLSKQLTNLSPHDGTGMNGYCFPSTTKICRDRQFCRSPFTMYTAPEKLFQLAGQPFPYLGSMGV